ncbi:hypothetical protein [Streptomyces varsoviensis]|uniref:hypothetical protein n=1 Tax=Streptomyces varsoviensis TaxID=67373 RepID=UPI000662BCE7|nr:hypothetical protein [Streptomyces varsoviensis]
MAKSQNTAQPSWAALLDLDADTYARLRYAGRSATDMVAVGQAWDTVPAGWEALAVAPLARGLAALDCLGLPLDGGFPVIADHGRCELIVLVEEGAPGPLAELQGVRVLRSGTSFLLVPFGEVGGYHAAWLSRPTSGRARYVDPSALRDAVLAAEAERAEHARAC